MGSICLRTYVEPELARKVSKMAQRQGRSESAFVAAALRAYVAAGAEGPARAAEDSQKRQLGRIEGEVLKIMPEQKMQKELLLLFVKVWLEHNPPLPPEIEASLAASADARFDRFLDIASISHSRGGLAHLHALDADEDTFWDADADVDAGAEGSRS
jgi:predicted transcriptional regulator